MLLEEVTNTGSHAALLKQWFAANTAHKDDPDDRHGALENPYQACERVIRELATSPTYKQFNLLDYDYQVKDVPISELKLSQQTDDQLSQDSMLFMASEHTKTNYAKLHRKHDVMPILLSVDNDVLDGYHRVAAAKHNGVSVVPALVPVRKGHGHVIGY